MNDAQFLKYLDSFKKEFGTQKCWLVPKVSRNSHHAARHYTRSFRLAHGKHPIDKPFTLHTCDCGRCINPAHLFAGNASDNMQDMVAKGRGLIGALNGAAKLTNKKVTKIKALAATKKYTYQQIGDMFRVTRGTIGRVVNNFTWKHI